MKKQLKSKLQNFLNAINNLIKNNIKTIKNLFQNINYYVKKNPYTRLMRLHQPIGIQLLIMPILWTLVCVSHNVVQFLYLSMLFIFGSIITRGAGVIINDIIDKDFDKNVKRTNKRPLASGELTVKKAIKFLCIVLFISLLILILLPIQSIYCGIFGLCLIIIYPFIKKYSYFPQIFLAFTFNIGVFIAWFSVEKYFSSVPILIYLSSIFWTIGYDTIYAFQDKIDDEKIGVKSTALKFRNNTKGTLNFIYTISIFSLVIVGLNANINNIYYLFILLGLLFLTQQIENVNLRSPTDCQQKFTSNVLYALLIFFGLIIGKL